jgi:transcriptional regulator with XRE-family HTH domain
MNKFSSRLKELRNSGSQSHFSQMLGVSQQKYSRWETGRFEPSISEILTICKTMGVTSDWLLGLSDERSGGGVRVTGDGNAVASASPGARLSAAAPTGDMERLLTIIESQQRVIARLAGAGNGV